MLVFSFLINQLDFWEKGHKNKLFIFSKSDFAFFLSTVLICLPWFVCRQNNVQAINYGPFIQRSEPDKTKQPNKNNQNKQKQKISWHGSGSLFVNVWGKYPLCPNGRFTLLFRSGLDLSTIPWLSIADELLGILR